MGKFLVMWNEEVQNNCSVEIEAETKEEALEKWENGEFEDYHRDESSNSFDEPSLDDVEEVEDSSET